MRLTVFSFTKYGAAFLFAALSLTIRAQPTNSGTHPYTADLDFFIQKLEETHPDPYTAFGGRMEFYRQMQKVRRAAGSIRSTDEFRNLLRGFISKLKDGHTFIMESAPFRDDSVLSLPLSFRISSDGLYIGRADKKYVSLTGNLVEAINHIPVAELAEKSALLKPSENIYGNYMNLSETLKDNIRVQKLFGAVDSLHFTLNTGVEKIRTTIPYNPAVHWAEKENAFDFSGKNGLLFGCMIGNAGYVRWNSIVGREFIETAMRDDPEHLENHMGWVFSYIGTSRTGNAERDIEEIPSVYKVFAQLLSDMKKSGSKHLIIDLRYNSGGMTPMIHPVLHMLYGDNYLSFDFNAEYNTRLSPLLVEKRGYGSMETYNNAHGTDHRLGEFLFGTLDGSNRTLSLEEKRALPKVNGYGGFGREQVLQGIKERTDSLRIFVLISPRTFSAAFHFAWYLWKMGATLVGVASSQAPDCFMESSFIRLPQTKIEVSISNSVQVLFPQDDKKKKTLLPDIEMNWTEYSTFRFDKDAELLKVLEIIHSDVQN